MRFQELTMKLDRRRSWLLMCGVVLLAALPAVAASERQTDDDKDPTELALEELSIARVAEANLPKQLAAEQVRSSRRVVTGPVRKKRFVWDKQERGLRWSFVGLSAVDAYQTMNAPNGVSEGNPFLSSWAGSHPSEVETVLFKAGTTYGVLKLTGRIKNPKTRRWVLMMLNSVQLSVNIHNERVTDGILF